MLAILLALLLACGGLAPAALADGTNVAEAVNDEDGSSVIDIAFDIRRVSSGVVDQTNVAAAYATCETCSDGGDRHPDRARVGRRRLVTPTNVAVALNEGCNACQTMALAYQFVFGNGGTITLSREARRKIREIARAFRDLERSGGSVDEVLQETNRLLGELSEALANGVETTGPPPSQSDEGDREEDDGDARSPRDAGRAPTRRRTARSRRTEGSEDRLRRPAPAPSETPAPSESPSPSATATPEPTATPSPTATATP